MTDSLDTDNAGLLTTLHSVTALRAVTDHPGAPACQPSWDDHMWTLEGDLSQHNQYLHLSGGFQGLGSFSGQRKMAPLPHPQWYHNRNLISKECLNSD